MKKRDFLTLNDLNRAEHDWLFRRSAELKRKRRAGEVVSTLAGKTLVLLFEKASTRTRVSFEAAMAELGGHPITLPTQDSQLARGEPLSDTARVLASYSHAIVMRTFADSRLRELAKNANVPVINGLTDSGHPVQLLADLFTLLERFGRLEGLRVVFLGDCKSNTAFSWAEASQLFHFSLVLSAPSGQVIDTLPSTATHVVDPRKAVAGADVVVTDVWASMGQEAEATARRKLFEGYTVDDTLQSLAAKHAVALHCLPAHRGEEITESVLIGPQSLVWDEAENRMHTQKALLEALILGVS